MFECQDAPLLTKALESNIASETLMHGSPNEREKAVLGNIFNNESNMSRIISHFLVQAKRPEGHPVLKNYGWARYTNPFERSKHQKEISTNQTGNDRDPN